jgi:hypothetical protein
MVASRLERRMRLEVFKYICTSTEFEISGESTPFRWKLEASNRPILGLSLL